MGAIASINFKGGKDRMERQEEHNDRTIRAHYFLKSGGLGIECNRSAQEAMALRDSLIEQAKANYKRCFNQSFKATRFVWSAVANIKPETTMQDLERLADHFKTKYGFQCFQIAIHRDEGHIDDEGKEQINHHAHLEFVTLDEKTGKSLFRKEHISNKVLSQMQTETADILGMQRGEDVKKSGRKRIEPRAYAQLMNETRQKHKAEKQELKATKDNTIEELKTQLATLKTTNAQLAAQLEELIALFATDKKPTARELKEKLKEARNQMMAINKLCGEDKLFTQEDYKDIKALEASNLEEGAKEIVSRALERFKARLVAPYTKELEDLKANNAQQQETINQLEQAIRQVKGLIVQKFDTALAEVTKGLKTQSAAVLRQKHEYEMATAELNAKLDILIERARKDKKLANAIKSVLNKMGFNKSLDDPGDFEPSLIDKQKQEIRRTSAQALKTPLEEVSKENAEHVSRLKTAFSSLTSAVEKVAQVVKDSQEYGKQLTAEQEKNEDLTRENAKLKQQIASEQENYKRMEGHKDALIEMKDEEIDKLTNERDKLKEQAKQPKSVRTNEALMQTRIERSYQFRAGWYFRGREKLRQKKLQERVRASKNDKRI
ncbi:hypothetical protein [Helicobacter ailurogastricus]|uniref:hypothetical protein n=1 Tax=Helicobacter ailurogastricus TaxID=1578720 RepID=UPI00244D992D|nr:hypothetical protein [Helicobacter ailurogastricus]GMB92217.1 hypothetical protein NHP190009_14000 [Helicobacter ailurogastricus]